MAKRGILARKDKDGVWIENGVVGCKVCRKEGIYTQEFYAKKEGEWKLIAQSINPSIVEGSNIRHLLSCLFR